MLEIITMITKKWKMSVFLLFANLVSDVVESGEALISASVSWASAVVTGNTVFGKCPWRRRHNEGR